MAALSAVNKVPDVETDTASLARNAAAQLGRIPGGAAKATVKTLAAPGILYEAAKQNTSDYRQNLKDAQKYISNLRESNPYLTQADLIDAKLAGKITQAQYDNYINEWQANGSPIDSGQVHGILGRTGTGETVAKPITEGTSKAITAIDNNTNSWVAAPQSGVAEVTAKVADTVGQAIPAAAAAVATSGLSASAVAIGTPLSYTLGSANAYGTEMVEGSGDNKTALMKAGSSWASEAIGGKLFQSSSLIGSAIGEGFEENIDGLIQSALTGQIYSLSDAASDFGYGFAAGAILGAGAEAINSVSSAITEGRVQKEVNSRIANTAAADVSDVKALISYGSDSAANAVIAQDSLTALQKQVANPVNTTQITSSIPSDIAQKYNLIPISDNPNGKPVTIKTQSYESIVAPEVTALTAPEVSTEARSTINPNDATTTNPRALYQYAQDVYLQPGTDLSDTMFTYRGQANQFYRTSQDAGSIPASGVGTSWEGSGVYSSPTTYTTDLYGPSGKLADNPYNNRGISQKAIDTNYSVGVILQQSAGVTENVSALTRTDAPSDAVAEGTRRVRYDDQGRQFVPEVINNPNDVSAAGLIFGRTGVAESTPIQYAMDSTKTVHSASTVDGVSTLDTVSDSASTQNSSAHRQASGVVIEENTLGTYTVPELINVNAVEVGITARSSDEKNSTALEAATSVASKAATESWSGATEGRAASESALTSLVKIFESTSDNTVDVVTPAPKTGVSESAIQATVSTSGNTSPEIALMSVSETSSDGAATANSDSINSQSVPEVRVTVDTPITVNAPVAEKVNTQTEESTTKVAPEVNESPAGATSGKTQASGESAGEELSSEELASQIWTPAQSMAKASQEMNDKRRKERDLPTYDFGITKGPGSRGLIDETSGYKTTFGGLSSF